MQTSAPLTPGGRPGRRRGWPVIRGLRWWIIGLVSLGTITSYLARNSLAVLGPQLKQMTGFSASYPRAHRGTTRLCHPV